MSALLREWGARFTVSRRGAFIDYDLSATGPLATSVKQRYRLYFSRPDVNDLGDLQSEAESSGRVPVAVAPLGLDAAMSPVAAIGTDAFTSLCNASGVVKGNDSHFEVDREALQELTDHKDPRIALLNGLLWLRPLSRDRVPPALRWTKTPAHELFERCFFLSMTSTFNSGGTSWGTRKRGRPIPDGWLSIGGLGAPVLYDCKASRAGYEMPYRDLTGFVDYLVDPIESDWKRGAGKKAYFLVVTSEFATSSSSQTFAKRRVQLARKAKDATLVWLRAPDLSRFGLAIERAGVTVAHRRSIQWSKLFQVGDIRWHHFQEQLARLERHGYSFV